MVVAIVAPFDENLGAVSYTTMINKGRQYRMPTTDNLIQTSSGWRFCLSLETELGYIQQQNPIHLSAVNIIMQILSEHIVESLGLNFERLGRIGNPRIGPSLKAA